MGIGVGALTCVLPSGKPPQRQEGSAMGAGGGAEWKNFYKCKETKALAYLDPAIMRGNDFSSLYMKQWRFE